MFFGSLLTGYFGDKYGRETPVFTEDDAAFDVPFKESTDVNQIYASLYGPQPNWAEYYKIYVKQFIYVITLFCWLYCFF